MSSATTPRAIYRVSSKRSSLRYDLRRRVLVSNLNRAVSPLTELKPVLSSKPTSSSAPLDLLKDLPGDKKTKQQCTSSHSREKTPEKKVFRMDPAVLSRNPIVHTPTKAPAKRRFSEPLKATMSIHLLREDYAPPTKKDCLRNVVLFNPSAVAETNGESGQEFHYDSPPARPVPLPRKSKMSTSSKTSSSPRPHSSNSNSSEEDPLYARIENCRTGSKEDLVKYGYTGNMTLRPKPSPQQFIEECQEGSRRRNSLPTSNSSRLRPRFSSTAGECRAKKSLLFSDGIDSTKTPVGLTVKNVHAEKTYGETTPLKDTISKIQNSPDDSAAAVPRILSQSGIYLNNTLVVESKKLKKDEIDKSYGFTCRMRPMLRALNGRTPPQLLPNKETRRKVDSGGAESPLTAVSQRLPPIPSPVICSPRGPPVAQTSPVIGPPRPPPAPRTSPVVCPPTNATPTKEIAIQTSFVVHDVVDCPQSKSSGKKRRRSMEIIAEVGAKVRRRSSVLRDKLCRSLTPNK